MNSFCYYITIGNVQVNSPVSSTLSAARRKPSVIIKNAENDSRAINHPKLMPTSASPGKGSDF